MKLEDQFKYLVGGYYGVSLMDEYLLKEYILDDIKKYIEDFVRENPIENFDYYGNAEIIKEKMSNKTKLQDALIVLNKIDGPIDLIFLIKDKLKSYSK